MVEIRVFNADCWHPSAKFLSSPPPPHHLSRSSLAMSAILRSLAKQVSRLVYLFYFVSIHSPRRPGSSLCLRPFGAVRLNRRKTTDTQRETCRAHPCRAGTCTSTCLIVSRTRRHLVPSRSRLFVPNMVKKLSDKSPSTSSTGALQPSPIPFSHVINLSPQRYEGSPCPHLGRLSS